MGKKKKKKPKTLNADIGFLTSPKDIEKAIVTTSTDIFPVNIGVERLAFYPHNGSNISLVGNQETKIRIYVAYPEEAVELYPGEILHIRSICPEEKGKYLYDRVEKTFIADVTKRKLYRKAGWGFQPPKDLTGKVLVTDQVSLAGEAICYRVTGWGSFPQILFASRYVLQGVYGDEENQNAPHNIGVTVLANYYLRLFEFEALDLNAVKYHSTFLHPGTILNFEASQLNTLGQIMAKPRETGKIIAGTTQKIKEMNVTDALLGESFPFEPGEIVNLIPNVKVDMNIDKMVCIGDMLLIITSDTTITEEKVKTQFDLSGDIKIRIRISK